jgi:3-dehydroquinate dehydratase
MRKAFNDADSGHEVVVERYGQNYQLISIMDKPKGHSFESTPTAINPITLKHKQLSVSEQFPKSEIPTVNKINSPEEAREALRKMQGITYTKPVNTA